MPDSIDERTPLLQFPGPDDNIHTHSANLENAYRQFCFLIGSKPSDHPDGEAHQPPEETLYHRVTKHRKMQNLTYQFTAALTNTLLLTQVVLGAAVTGLGASDSNRYFIIVFGALNTVIAGLIAFLKSRGQPMRARMFRDDLERVADEIDNSATMWLGICQGVHGYDEIDTDGSVTVRSEVARLTRLYDRAVRTNTMNDPDIYGGNGGGSADPHSAALRPRPDASAVLPVEPTPAPASGGDVPAPVPILGPAADPDESPATKAPTPPPDDTSKADSKSDDGKGKDSTSDEKTEKTTTNVQTQESSSESRVEQTSSGNKIDAIWAKNKGKGLLTE